MNEIHSKDVHDSRDREEGERVRERVRAGYTEVAAGRAPLATPDAEAQARSFGYSDADLASVPKGANLGLGCGNPTTRAGLQPGERVLDLGCGAGVDVFLASRVVGPRGRVIGVDMTEALLERARASARETGFDNVEFRLGAMESLPVEDDAVDVVVSNCAINLSPEKERVFAEIARVLRPGGRVRISDLVVEQPLPSEVRESVEAYIGCVGGAITRAEYAELVARSGLVDVEIEPVFALGDMIEPDDPRVLQVIRDAGGSYTEAEIRSVLDSIVSLSIGARAPQASQVSQAAQAAKACCAPRTADVAETCAPPTVAVGPDTQEYRDLMSYIVSQAVAGEIMAVENYSDMVALFPDVEGKLEAVEQAREEGRHIRQLAKLGRRLGYDVEQRIVEPEWKAVRAAFREAVARGDLAACLVIQDIMVESMAIVLYQTLAGDDDVETDSLTARITAAILEDELEHLEIGTRRLRQMRERAPEAVDAALAWAHPRVMPQLFDLANTRCETLCDELALDCASLDPGAINADLGLLRTRAATRYVAALDAVGFAPSTTGPLIASMSSYELDDADARVCCAKLDGPLT